jgi:16S rRNA (cytosine967-C5)-methyltransferase
MTPQARVAAAIDALDLILAGQSAEKTMTTWARKNRYAGSKDRAAIRDLVFDALRQQSSSVHMGGSPTGRGIMLGQMRLQGIDPDTVFTGQGYAPVVLSDTERAHQTTLAEATDAIRLDCPDWLLPLFQSSLAEKTDEVLNLLRMRAPVFLRVNITKATVESAIKVLADEDIDTQTHPLSPTALEVTRNSRRVRHSSAFQTGLVELQDAASQAVSDAFCAAVPEGSVLDYCAGGGGKALALAAKGVQVSAHDVAPERMADIPVRAARACTPISIIDTPEGQYDAVLCDAPCSGSGAWRRQPEAKWRLTPDALGGLTATQDSILDAASALVRPGGVLGYATCSLLAEENSARAAAFEARHVEFRLRQSRQLTPLEGADGFFLAIFDRS